MGRKRKYDTPEEYLKSIAEKSKKFLQDHQEVRLFNSAKINSKLKGIEFSLTKQDVQELLLTTKYCRYLGVEVTNISGKGRVPTNASLDRIDNSKGYTKENIQIISDLANRMKQEATQEQLLTFAKNILETE